MSHHHTLAAFIGLLAVTQNIRAAEPVHLTYRFFDVVEAGGSVLRTVPIEEETPRPWAADVSQTSKTWTPVDSEKPLFESPIPFVIAPREGSTEPFHPHNHQPDIAWLPNGDLMAIWYTTIREQGTELTVVASRLRAGKKAWEPASEFFKASQRNMHGNSLYFNEATGTLHHMNGMGRRGAEGWENLALLHRHSVDNGVTWSVARPVSSGKNYQRRHQVIAGMTRMPHGTLIQACDATPGGEGPSAIHISYDDGKTWADPGGDIQGIHTGVEALRDGRLFAFGRAQAIDGRMPISISEDMGRTWSYSASPFPPISGGQRLVLMRLREGPLLLVSFTNRGSRDTSTAMTFNDANGGTFEGIGMFAALSRDEGKTWPVRKLLTPGEGEYNAGAWTGSFKASSTRAEHAGYLAATQAPDGVIHLISSRLHYRFNLKWIETGAAGL